MRICVVKEIVDSNDNDAPRFFVEQRRFVFVAEHFNPKVVKRFELKTNQ